MSNQPQQFERASEGHSPERGSALHANPPAQCAKQGFSTGSLGDTMPRALLIRTIATWLFLAAGFICCFVVSGFLKMTFQAFGPDYPSSISVRIPASTQYLLEHSSLIMNMPIFSAAAGLLASLSTIKFASSAESRLHYLTLTAAFLLYVTLMMAIMFALMFFLLPKSLSVA